MPFHAIYSAPSQQDISSEAKRPTTVQLWPGHPPTPRAEFAEMRPEPCTPSTTSESKKACDISNLMSPPEPVPLDSFQSRHQEPMEPHHPAAMASEKRRVDPPLSPPVSPPSKPSSAVVRALPIPPTSLSLHDPIIFPVPDASGATTGSSAKPLFIPTVESLGAIQAVTTKQLVDQHIASRPANLFRGATPPRPEDYELALYFKSNCFNIMAENPKAYLRKERELLRADRKPVGVTRPLARLPHILPASGTISAHKLPAQVSRFPPVTSGSRISKVKSPTLKSQAPRPIRATPAATRPTIRVSSTPEPRTRTVAANREDKDFNSLPNLCPPLSSLPAKPNSLKVDWKGAALDLSKDPHAHLLHPDELALAAGLRLDCATYLTSKRRIFIRRLECARIKKEFRKTDAQQACKIDVNKASKLWMAYEKVGWLDPKWMAGVAE